MEDFVGTKDQTVCWSGRHKASELLAYLNRVNPDAYLTLRGDVILHDEEEYFRLRAGHRADEHFLEAVHDVIRNLPVTQFDAQSLVNSVNSHLTTNMSYAPPENAIARKAYTERLQECRNWLSQWSSNYFQQNYHTIQLVIEVENRVASMYAECNSSLPEFTVTNDRKFSNALRDRLSEAINDDFRRV